MNEPIDYLSARLGREQAELALSTLSEHGFELHDSGCHGRYVELLRKFEEGPFGAFQREVFDRVESAVQRHVPLRFWTTNGLDLTYGRCAQDSTTLTWATYGKHLREVLA